MCKGLAEISEFTEIINENRKNSIVSPMKFLICKVSLQLKKIAADNQIQK